MTPKLAETQNGQKHTRQYPLLMVSNHPRWGIHANHEDITWFREIETCKVRGADGYQYNPLWIHPTDAEKRGIKAGDVVNIFNERGGVLCGAYITERIMPGVVSTDHGAKHDPIIPKEIRDLGYGERFFDVNGALKWFSEYLLTPEKKYPIIDG